MILVIRIKNDLIIPDPLTRQIPPERPKRRIIGDNRTIVSSKVVGIDDSVAAGISDVCDDCRVVGEIGGPETGGGEVGSHAFHGEGDAEDVVALGHECLCLAVSFISS